MNKSAKIVDTSFLLEVASKQIFEYLKIFKI